MNQRWQPERVVPAGQDLVYAATIDGRLHALDAFTGEKRWVFAGSGGVWRGAECGL